MLILRWLLAVVLRGKELVSMLVIVAFCLWLSQRTPDFQQAWRMGLVSTVFYPVQAVVGALRVRASMRKTLEEAKAENALLVAENAKLTELLRERAERGAFDSSQLELPAGVVPARVLSRNPTRLGGVWILDAGGEKGISEGMAVLTSKGVVGRILSAGPGHSALQSLADPDCRIAVLSARSRNPGLVFSPDGAHTQIEYSVTSDIAVGDSLVTWGAGGIFPRGLPVGRVAELLPTPAGILRKARIVPFQNPWRVEDVFVLLRAPILRLGGDVPSDSVPLDTIVSDTGRSAEVRP